jgi:hypothetical protein
MDLEILFWTEWTDNSQGFGDIASITRARSIVFEKGDVKGLETTQGWEIEEGIGMRIEA